MPDKEPRFHEDGSPVIEEEDPEKAEKKETRVNEESDDDDSDVNLAQTLEKALQSLAPKVKSDPFFVADFVQAITSHTLRHLLQNLRHPQRVHQPVRFPMKLKVKLVKIQLRNNSKQQQRQLPYHRPLASVVHHDKYYLMTHLATVHLAIKVLHLR